MAERLNDQLRACLIRYQEHNGPHNETKHFWVVNDSVFVIPLTSILSDIRDFIRISGEMVIMDIREFPFGKRQQIE